MNNKIHKLFWFTTSTRWNNTETLQWLMAGKEHGDMLFTCRRCGPGQHARSWFISYNAVYEQEKNIDYVVILIYLMPFCQAKPSYFTCQTYKRAWKDIWHVPASAMCNAVKCFMICMKTHLNVVHLSFWLHFIINIFSVAQSIHTIWFAQYFM